MTRRRIHAGPYGSSSVRTVFLVQLGPDVHPTPEPPRALESKTSQLHAKQSAIDVVQTENLAPGDTIIELDSHHGGSWLGGFVEAGLVPRLPTRRRTWSSMSIRWRTNRT